MFSFDTLRGWPRPGKCALATLAICVAVRMALALAGRYLEQVPAHFSNDRFMYLEQKLVRDNPVRPRLLLLGNSLMRYGLQEEQLAQLLGMQNGEVVNVAVENGGPWDALVMLRRNPSLLVRGTLVLYAFDFGQVNRHGRARWVDHYYTFSTLREKLMADAIGSRATLLLDWLWPYHSQRRDLPMWLQGFRQPGQWNCETPLRPAWTDPNLVRHFADTTRFDMPPSVEAVIGLDSAISREHVQHLRHLIAFCHEHGMEFVAMTPPVREVYDRTIRGDSGLRAGLNQYERTLVELDVPYLLCHRPVDRHRLQLHDSSDFLDYTHLNANGSAKLGRFVAAELIRRHWLPATGGYTVTRNDASSRWIRFP